MFKPEGGRLAMGLEFAWHCATLALGIYVLLGPAVAWAVAVLCVFVIVGTIAAWTKAAAARSRKSAGDQPGGGLADRVDEIARDVGGAPKVSDSIERQRQPGEGGGRDV